jgi:hypothetical protein
MADPRELAANRNRRAAFDRLRLAEAEIHRRWVNEGDVPDSWWVQLLKAIAEYRNAADRCKGAR